MSQNAAAVKPAVPFLDLSPVHEHLREEILADLGAVIDSNAFVNGPAVAAFESAFASYCGVEHCVGLASGLDALRIALMTQEFEPGDEVIVPANTFFATFEAITQAGLRPVPVDASELDYCLDPALLAGAVGPRTRALVPVHLYGQVADMVKITAFAEQHGLAMLEDAAQAHGAERDGVRSGTSGFASAFSFYPGKNLGAMGDAGALVTGSEAVATRARALREHGQRAKYIHEWIGYTARLDTMQAVVLHHKLPHLDGWNAKRVEGAAWYSAALEGVGDLRLPPVPPGSAPVWHLYVVRTRQPEALGAFLAEHGVGSGRHYPQPPHLSPAYSWLGLPEGSAPVTEALARECLSLPLYPGINEAQLARVCSVIEEYFARGR